MDCCPAAGVRHGVGTGACLKETQPLPVRPHQLLRVPASPKTQGCKCSMRSYGVSSFSQAVGADRVPSSPRILASRHANTSTTANNLPENEALSSNADCNTSNYNERNRGQNGAGNTTFTQLPSRVNSTNCSISEYQTSMEESSKLSTAKISNNGRAGSTSCADDISSPSVDSTRKSGSDDQNENTSLPASLTDEMTKPGPLMEIHNHVAGKESPSSESDSSLSHLLSSRNIVEFISRFPSWADEQKESGMPQRQRRAFYSHEDWLRHRSSLRYVRHVLSSVSSRVIVSLVPPVFTFTAGAIGVAAYNTALKYGYLPSFLPLLHAASLPYELTAPALALLLVFRTDASYSRYDEARKTWTSVISTTKDLARLSAQLIKSPQDVALKSSLLSYIMAFPVSLKCHLIYGSDTPSELQRLLQHDDLAFVLKSQHRPNCLIQLISQAMDLLHLEKTDRVLLEDHIRQYVASVSVCERLIRTPIPLSYTRLTSRFLVLWHISLPIVLWDACGWLAVPATFFSAATLFCIEEVGVLIEEPFPMLALDKIIGIAHENIRELMKRQQETDRFLSLKKKTVNK
ncbi:hypothetical protein GOP47_0011025 [Adiantum capillus-veneris]|uniref:Uncharacterized protein n=1 Tax=Adiantum capillus-veneris TaxID=13818 RepID=A0A9D4UW22_ADICA|nr:hypothetical protein GOP47_0011025 [Adiantum capillus-veneris]